MQLSFEGNQENKFLEASLHRCLIWRSACASIWRVTTRIHAPWCGQSPSRKSSKRSVGVERSYPKQLNRYFVKETTLTYPSPVCPDGYRSCTGRGPAGGFPRGPTPLSSKGAPRLRRRPPRHQALRMWPRPSDRAPRPPVKLRAGSMDRVGKAWTSPRHLPTPCPHSVLLRPHSHRFCNNESWKRQRHRRRPVPALLRHPRKSVYGILRPIPAVIPRGNARNSTYAWLKSTLQKIAGGHPQSRVHELLPWAFTPASS